MNKEVGDRGGFPIGRILTCKQRFSIHEQTGELECEMIVNVERMRRRPGSERQEMRLTTKIQQEFYSPLSEDG